MTLNRFHRVLRGLVIVAGAVDLILGLVLLFAPLFLSRILGVPLPEEIFWIRVIGLLQVGVAWTYIQGGVSPQRYRGNIILGALMRLAMSVLLITAGMQRPAFRLFIFVGVLEGAIGICAAVYVAGPFRSQK